MLRTIQWVVGACLFLGGGAVHAGPFFSGLGDLPGGSFFSIATGVSADGSVVVGSGTPALTVSNREAYRWTAAGGMVGLGDLAGSIFSSSARGVSADGTVIVGRGVSASGTEAYRWTAGSGMVGLGDLPGGELLQRRSCRLG